jgi:5,10-methenyltetrahydromethanopterin hydrogenase
VESWTKFSDEMLDLIKAPKTRSQNSHEIIPRIMKKVNKIAKQAWKPSQNLAIIRNEFFEQGEE